jgi:hypothetical protein
MGPTALDCVLRNRGHHVFDIREIPCRRTSARRGSGGIYIGEQLRHVVVVSHSPVSPAKREMQKRD